MFLLRPFRFVPALLVVLALCGCPFPGGHEDVLFQYATIDAFMLGQYEGYLSVGGLLEAGDFGLGTFNGVDGEMLVLDGVCYRMPADGQVVQAHPDTLIPFAAVTPFTPDRLLQVGAGHDYASLREWLDGQLPSLNLFYAVRIDGVFPYVKARSIARQTPPYRPFEEVAPEQIVFEFEEIEGTLVGFRCPDYVDGLNVPGYHFHFIAKDRQRGGHVLELSTGASWAWIDTIHGFEMLVPDRGPFLDADFSQAGEYKSLAP